MKSEFIETLPYQKIINYAICPFCGETTSSVDHLLQETTETLWYCDKCGGRYGLKFENGKMFICKTDERKDKTLVFLQAGYIVLIVEGLNLSGIGTENNAYYYNEHTCPTNYMKDVIKVIDLRNRDTDPHGIFEYKKTVPYDKRIEDCDDIETIESIFKNDLACLTQK